MPRPMTVLIADDDKLTLNVLNDTLTRAGYDVLTATDGDGLRRTAPGRSRR